MRTSTSAQATSSGHKRNRSTLSDTSSQGSGKGPVRKKTLFERRLTKEERKLILKVLKDRCNHEIYTDKESNEQFIVHKNMPECCCPYLRTKELKTYGRRAVVVGAGQDANLKGKAQGHTLQEARLQEPDDTVMAGIQGGEGSTGASVDEYGVEGMEPEHKCIGKFCWDDQLLGLYSQFLDLQINYEITRSVVCASSNCSLSFGMIISLYQQKPDEAEWFETLLKEEGHDIGDNSRETFWKSVVKPAWLFKLCQRCFAPFCIRCAAPREREIGDPLTLKKHTFIRQGSLQESGVIVTITNLKSSAKNQPPWVLELPDLSKDPYLNKEGVWRLLAEAKSKLLQLASRAGNDSDSEKSYSDNESNSSQDLELQMALEQSIKDSQPENSKSMDLPVAPIATSRTS